jgi:hypothetical protein
MAEKKRETTKPAAPRGGRKAAPTAETSNPGGPKSAPAAKERAPQSGSASVSGGMAAPKSKAGPTRTRKPIDGDGVGENQPPKTGRGRAGTGAAAAKKGGKQDLQKDLREFASARPSGWEHDDWLNFLESLRSRGHNVNDRDAIGLALEKERLDLALGGVKGITAQRRKGLVEKYGNVWRLRTADPGEVAAASGLKRDAVERMQSDLS